MEEQQQVPLRQLLSQLQSQKKGALETQIARYCYSGLSQAAHDRLTERGIDVYEGKVRACLGSADKLLLLHTDRLSAFDRFVSLVPFKGAILASLSHFWHDKLKAVVPSALLSAPAERLLLMRRLTPFKIEIVVRGYLAGSMQRAYAKGERVFCGEELPEGLQPYQKLPQPLVTPTTKAAAYAHDEAISASELVAQGLCSATEWQQLRDWSLAIYRCGSEVFATKGWILADTKYEFGKDRDGNIFLIDEVHTPDSSRLWRLQDYLEKIGQKQEPVMFDKEIVRRYLLAQGFRGDGPVPEVPVSLLLELLSAYLNITEELWGQPFLVQEKADEETFLAKTQ